MKVYTCEGCGAEIREKKPDACPFCGEHEFSVTERDEHTSTDDKEHFLMELAEKELEKYMEDTEPVDLKYYNNGE